MENFDRENIDELLEICQFVNIFPRQNFAPYGKTKAVPSMASVFIQCWAFTLSSYEYELKYRKGKDQGNCDALSQLSLPDCPDTVPLPGDILLLSEQLSSSPITAHEIKIHDCKRHSFI